MAAPTSAHGQQVAPAPPAPAPGSAQSAPAPTAGANATARILFEEGVSLSDDGQWAQAADRFERVLAIRWSSAAAFNLAAALVELQRLVDASERYRQVARDEGAAKEMRAAAEQAVSDIEPKLGRLHVLVAGDARGLEIFIDGQALAPAAWGVPVVVDPGTHSIMALRRGETLTSQNVIVGDGAPLSAEILLDVPTVSASAPSPAATAAAYGESGPERTRHADGQAITDTWWFWSGAGVLAATAVTIVLVAVLSSGGSDGTSPVSGTLDPGVLAGAVEPNP